MASTTIAMGASMTAVHAGLEKSKVVFLAMFRVEVSAYAPMGSSVARSWGRSSVIGEITHAAMTWLREKRRVMVSMATAMERSTKVARAMRVIHASAERGLLRRRAGRVYRPALQGSGAAVKGPSALRPRYARTTSITTAMA